MMVTLGDYSIVRLRDRPIQEQLIGFCAGMTYVELDKWLALNSIPMDNALQPHVGSFPCVGKDAGFDWHGVAITVDSTEIFRVLCVVERSSMQVHVAYPPADPRHQPIADLIKLGCTRIAIDEAESENIH